MRRRDLVRPGRVMTIVAAAWLLLIAGAKAADAPAADARRDLLNAHPGVRLFEPGGRISRVYGRPFSAGATARASAEAFIQQHAGAFNVDPAALTPNEQRTRPIMFDRAPGAHRFIVVSYDQSHSGLPVQDARLILLARNEPGFPLVLASSTLRDLRGFAPAAAVIAAPNAAAARRMIQRQWPGAAVDVPQTVIWAGTIQQPAPPRVALRFVAERGSAGGPDQEKWLIYCDARSGEMLHKESLLLHGGIAGTARGLVTRGFEADICGPESAAVLPYVRVAVGADSVFADSAGAFVIPVSGGGPATVEASLRGRFFRVFNMGGPDSVLTLSVAPPGQAAFLFNPLNEELTRAEVNAYLHVNIARDYLLQHVPDYPVIASQADFPVRVNFSGGSCDASYDGTGVNFLQASPSGSRPPCPNSAFSTVVYHEYGHHVAHSGGEGAADYGEGMADAIAVLVSDDPDFATGLFGECGMAIRSAVNSLHYPCGTTEPHFCGQILSGSVWDTRNALQKTHPDDFRHIITALTLNSIMLHGPEGIDPGLTVDFLTIDDDNGLLADGTPHYLEIASGFGAHGLDAPPLVLLTFEFPDGLPEFVAPAGGTAVRVDVAALVGAPSPGSLQFFVDSGNGFAPGAVNMLAPNQYEATLPASPCGSELKFYFTAQTTTGQTEFFPPAAPDESLKAFSAAGLGATLIVDELEGDTSGWVSDWAIPVFGGFWQHAVPNATFFGSQPAAPGADATAAPGVMAFVTQNDVQGAPAGAADVDGGPVYLTSPSYDLAGEIAFVEYAAWFFSSAWPGTAAADALHVEISADDGANWIPVETISDTAGQWQRRRFSINHVVTPTHGVRLRFWTFDSLTFGLSSAVEAGIDDLKIMRFNCNEGPAADLNGDGVVNTLDLGILLSSWTIPPSTSCAPPCPADINDDGVVNTLDLGILLSSWTL